MKKLIATAVLLVLLTTAGSAVSRKLDPDINACVQPQTMTAQDISDCLDKLIDSSAREMEAAYERAMAAVDPKTKVLLKKAQDAFYAYARSEAEAGRGVWESDGGLAGTALTDAMINGVTRARERRDELVNLYVNHRRQEKSLPGR
jgi:uncharacterized protein YecT (DUF1311 family)